MRNFILIVLHTYSTTRLKAAAPSLRVLKHTKRIQTSTHNQTQTKTKMKMMRWPPALPPSDGRRGEVKELPGHSIAKKGVRTARSISCQSASIGGSSAGSSLSQRTGGPTSGNHAYPCCHHASRVHNPLHGRPRTLVVPPHRPHCGVAVMRATMEPS